MQAGPQLVVDGDSLIDGEDREGLSAAAAQFDSDYDQPAPESRPVVTALVFERTR